MDTASKLLLRLGVPANLKGFRYICDALELLQEDYNGYWTAFQKKLYPVIAKKEKTTVAAVERSIRTAVFTAFGRMTPQIQETYFGNSVAEWKGIATNKEFIAAVLLHLENEGAGADGGNLRLQNP